MRNLVYIVHNFQTLFKTQTYPKTTCLSILSSNSNSAAVNLGTRAAFGKAKIESDKNLPPNLGDDGSRIFTSDKSQKRNKSYKSMTRIDRKTLVDFWKNRKTTTNSVYFQHEDVFKRSSFRTSLT